MTKKDDINVFLELIHKKALFHNELFKEICHEDGTPIEDFDKNNLLIELERKHKVKMSNARFERLLNSELVPSRNPIKEWKESLQKVNYSNEIERMLESFTFRGEQGDQERSRRWLLKFCCSVMASIDGKPVRTIVVLIGPQNIGKTWWLTHLLPEALQPYVVISNLEKHFDQLLLASSLLVILDEFRALSKLDTEHLKSLSSLQRITIIRKYEKSHVSLKRLAVMVGTSNSSAVTNDSTGNTRILPVPLVARDFEAMDNVDRHKLWAAILARYEAQGDSSYMLDAEEMAELQEITKEHSLPNPYEENLFKFFRRMNEEEDMETKQGWMPSEITSYINRKTGEKLNCYSMGRELGNLGFERSKRNRRYYLVKPNPLDLEGNPVPDDEDGNSAPQDDPQEAERTVKVPF